MGEKFHASSLALLSFSSSLSSSTSSSTSCKKKHLHLVLVQTHITQTQVDFGNSMLSFTSSLRDCPFLEYFFYLWCFQFAFNFPCHRWMLRQLLLSSPHSLQSPYSRRLIFQSYFRANFTIYFCTIYASITSLWMNLIICYFYYFPVHSFLCLLSRFASFLTFSKTSALCSTLSNDNLSINHFLYLILASLLSGA